MKVTFKMHWKPALLNNHVSEFILDVNSVSNNYQSWMTPVYDLLAGRSGTKIALQLL